MSAIYLYAEILTHIRQVSLYASLRTEKNEHTKIDISSDKKIITVLHDGDQASLFFPTGIGGSAQVTIPHEKKKELSIRLKIADLNGLPNFDAAVSPDDYPWTARDLSAATQVACKVCETIIVERGNITVWKDLPAEDWEEMMDLWHCHRPHKDQSNGNAAETQGYAPASKLTASHGTGFVDVSTFLVALPDCSNVNVTPPLGADIPNKLSCQRCGTILGHRDEPSSGWRLRKYRVAVKPHPPSSWETYPVTTFISAQLQHLITAHAARQFIIHTKLGPSPHALLLWVFNPSVWYTSSHHQPGMHRAMKVFVQPTDDQHDDDDEPRDHIYLPRAAFAEFAAALSRSTAALPPAARAFNQWSVALLDCHDRTPERMNALGDEFKSFFTSGVAVTVDGHGPQDDVDASANIEN